MHTQAAVQQIADFLLEGTDKVGPQGFGVSGERGEQYWKMFLEEVSLPYDDSDQAFMRRVLNASAEELAELASKEVTAKALLDYEFALRPNLQGLLLAMVQQNGNSIRITSDWRSVYRWERDLFDLLRNVYQSNRMTWNFREEFEQAMHLAIKSDPSLAARVERAFLDPQKFQGWFDSDQNYERMSERIRDQFREYYAPKVDELVSKPLIPFTLKQLCFGFDSRENVRDPDPKGIPWWCPPFFQEIIQKMECSEDIRARMLPQLAVVLVSGNPHRFNRELANSLFGGTESLFRLVLAEKEPDMEGDPSMALLFHAAKASLVP